MRLLNIAVSALLIILVAALFYKDYASVFRNNKELVKSLSPSQQHCGAELVVCAQPHGQSAAGEDWRRCQAETGDGIAAPAKPDDCGAGRNLARRELSLGGYDRGD